MANIRDMVATVVSFGPELTQSQSTKSGDYILSTRALVFLFDAATRGILAGTPCLAFSSSLHRPQAAQGPRGAPHSGGGESASGEEVA